MIYKIVLTVHILGAIAMFVSVGYTMDTMLAMLRLKETKQLQSLAKKGVKLDEFLPFTVLFVLIPGLYLVITSWGWKAAWINVTLVVLVLMCIAGPLVNLKRLKRISAAVNEESSTVPSAQLKAIVGDKVLWNSVSIFCMELIGIVVLMTVKTGLIGSIITMVAGFIVGPIIANIILRQQFVAQSENTTKMM